MVYTLSERVENVLIYGKKINVIDEQPLRLAQVIQSR